MQLKNDVDGGTAVLSPADAAAPAECRRCERAPILELEALRNEAASRLVTTHFHRQPRG